MSDITRRNDITELIDFIGSTRATDLKWELKKLQAIRDWVIETHVQFEAGDVVEMIECPNMDRNGGWKSYEPSMQPGQRAVIQEVEFNTHWKYWGASIVFDRELYWDDFNNELREAVERKHTFMMPVKYLRKVATTDDDDDLCDSRVGPFRCQFPPSHETDHADDRETPCVYWEADNENG